MKRALLLVVLACIWAVPARAANQISSMDIDAVIYEDGSMYITQTWNTSFDEGTESYIPLNAPEYLILSDLKVTDGQGEYRVLDRWDTDAGFAEKADKCGVVPTEAGYEICFGISRYGENRYAIEYRLQNAVGAYSDMDGMNFRFVNDGMNTTPTDVNVEIRLADGTPLTDKNCDVWAFGYQGKAGLDGGAVWAYTEVPLTGENHVTVLLALPKGVIDPARIESGSFAQIKDRALAGSDYSGGEQGSALEVALLLLLTAAITAAIIAAVVTYKKKGLRRAVEQFSEQAGYFRDLPNSGDENATYAMGRLFGLCEDGAVLGTGLLRLMELGSLAPVSEVRTGFMGRSKEVVSLRLTGCGHGGMDEFDEYLYTVLEGAAGAGGVLQAKELERFSNRHDALLRAYVKKREEAGRGYLRVNRCLSTWQEPYTIRSLTARGQAELAELLGFKRYLTDFSLIAERGVRELPIWREMLSYALLFGIADEVARQLGELYPEIAAEAAQYSQTVFTAFAYCRLMSVNMRQAEAQREQTARSAGSGGFSSIGGGGGSIGGGSGGGTR